MLKKMLGLLAGMAMTVTAAAAPVPPDQMIHDTTEQMRTLIRQNVKAYQADKPKFYQAVDQVLVPHFDTKYIARSILGRYSRQATPDQLGKFEDAFKNMLVRGYADELLENYDSVSVDYQPVKLADGQTDATVTTIVHRAKSPQPATINFQVHVADGEWKIYDVTVENISLVINFRTQVGAEIKRTSIDDVIARMQSGQLIKPDVKQPAGDAK